MIRKINDTLIRELTATKGELNPLLNYLKEQKNRLRLEVRTGGKFIIYYKKCKVLEVGLRSFKVDRQYFVDAPYPVAIEDTIKNRPCEYFDYTCSVVEEWLAKPKNNKKEFDTQQRIAQANQDLTDKYVILDMEYNFPQNGIGKQDRVKRAGFDLVGMERGTTKIVFFEVKRGLKALRDKSGIAAHIRDFETCLYGTHKEIFRENILTNVKHIVHDKTKLGLLNFMLPSDFTTDDFEFIFIFEPDQCTIEAYEDIFRKEAGTAGYKTIFVSEGNYKLG